MRKLFSTRKQLLQLLSCLILLFSCIKSFAQQNLVPNPSFEHFSVCPDNSVISIARDNKPDLWYKPDLRNAVYFNRCVHNQPIDGVPYNSFGGGVNYQEPKTGNAYIVMLYYNQNANNYLQVKLVDSLKLASKYYAEYYVSLGDTYLKGCNNIAMLFTNNPIYVDTNSATYPYLLQANPQIVGYGNPIVTDTMGWVKISGIFTAQGGEQYLTLGNFKLASQTQFTQIAPFGTGYNGAAYYVDDVAVYNLDSFCLKADAGRDTTIKIGDSVFIGSYTNGIDSIKWFNASGQLIDSIRPGFWVKPTTAGTYMYIVQQTVNGCFSRDTVYVNMVLPLRMMSYNVISMNEKSVENIWQTANEINVAHFNVQRSTNAKDFTTIGKVKAKNKNYNEYSFTDQLIPNTQYPTHLYYRVVGVDFDGKFSYSQVKKLSTINYKPSTINIYPNPTKGLIHILIPSDEKAIWTITVQDVLGKVISTKQTTALTKSMDMLVSNQRGMYFITLTNNKTGKRIVEKVVVE